VDERLRDGIDEGALLDDDPLAEDARIDSWGNSRNNPGLSEPGSYCSSTGATDTCFSSGKTYDRQLFS